VLLSEDQIYVKEVEHLYCLTPRFNKEDTLYKILEYENPPSSMVFCNTKEETRQVSTFLGGKGMPAALLSSDLPQKKREKVMAQFRSGEIHHLVTTDVASRGIDIEDLSHVFIFSTPDSPEQYIHRAGRTGRVGKTGRAISLVGAHDLMNFNRLVNRYHIKVKELSIPTEEEVSARKVDRVLETLLHDAEQLPVADALELLPVARRLAQHEERDRLIAALLKKRLEPVPVEADEDDEPSAPPPPRGPRPHGGGGSGGRSRRPQRRPRR
jgi:ATP-dependent RNA helicase DeaD